MMEVGRVWSHLPQHWHTRRDPQGCRELDHARGRERRHPTQVVEDLPDGSVVWQVEVPLSEDLVHFIVGYGPHATVLEPEELRRRVVAWAKGAVAANEGVLSPEGVTGLD